MLGSKPLRSEQTCPVHPTSLMKESLRGQNHTAKAPLEGYVQIAVWHQGSKEEAQPSSYYSDWEISLRPGRKPEHGQKKACIRHVWKSKLTPASINVAFSLPTPQKMIGHSLYNSTFYGGCLERRALYKTLPALTIVGIPPPPKYYAKEYIYWGVWSQTAILHTWYKI